jgi:hypothetical protein
VKTQAGSCESLGYPRDRVCVFIGCKLDLSIDVSKCVQALFAIEEQLDSFANTGTPPSIPLRFDGRVATKHL